METMIKFRAWSKECKKFVDYCHVTLTGKAISLDGADFCGSDIVFQQFTGLKDKNGKEVFAGDIDKNYGEIVFGKIGYDGKWNGLTGFYFKKEEDVDDGDIKFLELDYIFDPLDLEIIGNIFENPELI